MTTNRPLNSGASVGVGGTGVTVGVGRQLADSTSPRMASQFILFIMLLFPLSSSLGHPKKRAQRRNPPDEQFVQPHRYDK